MYDQFSFILGIETTVNDVSFFEHYREVEHCDGSRVTKRASMQKTICGLPALRELLSAANRRYLEFLSRRLPGRLGSSAGLSTTTGKAERSGTTDPFEWQKEGQKPGLTGFSALVFQLTDQGYTTCVGPTPETDPGDT
jgi:hypothetical protein